MAKSIPTFLALFARFALLALFPEHFEDLALASVAQGWRGPHDLPDLFAVVIGLEMASVVMPGHHCPCILQHPGDLK